MMKKVTLLVGIFTMMLVLASNGLAQDDLIESVKKGCKTELETFCKEVTPGQGRVLACLYAHGDKLSGSCEFALYDAAARLERVVAALTYVANECDEDMDKFCSEVAVGQGRLLECLKKNKKQLDKRCVQALDEVGLK
ncbi:MAG: hypothetical protein JJV98_01650 [Desulfosarcina sp.]|nr:hypothetical protein [Desulfobacterales bacterium]